MTTVLALPRSDISRFVPPLLVGRSLVALVPVTDDDPWATRAAWDVARRCAATRRVALVDLRLDAPALHDALRLPADLGIVDALEHEVSWTRVAREVEGVFFIGAGSKSTGPAEVLAHPRWPRLHAGFRSEGALLLVYCSATDLLRLAALPDGMLVLAPHGLNAESPEGAAVAALLERGTALLGVVRGAEPFTEPDAAPAAPRRRWLRTVAAAIGLAVIGAGGWTILGRTAERPAPPPAVIVTPHADSVAWTVQLAAYGRPEKAVAAADILAAQGIGTFVSPVTLDATGVVWYRVLAGAYVTRDAAIAGRADIWRRGLAKTGDGELLHAPYSLRLATSGMTRPDALRRQGLLAVRWGTAGSIVIGAFETPEQSSFAAAALKGVGLTATLVTRAGTTP
jgi:hypothetical protein